MIVEMSVLIAITMGLTQVLKKIDRVPSTYLPVLVIIIGVLITQIANFEQFESVLNGLIVGLSAMGMYSGGKATIGK